MKLLENDYQLANRGERLSAEDIRRVLTDFEFFMSNYQQIVNKERKMVPFKLNAFQRKLFETLLPMVHPATRLDRRTTVVIIKGRQVGASVGVSAFINYLCAFVEGMENLSIAHTFPATDTVSKFYMMKVKPIITGVHPDLFPTVERENLSSSIVTHYRDIKGIRRNNHYELVSANASSIRSSTINIVLEDEVAFYAHPEDLDNAIMPALPDYGFSLVVYLSTFEDKKSEFFQNKLKIALDNPEDHVVIFAPWFLSYPERPQGIDYNDLDLTEYDQNVIIPAMVKEGVPKERWGDCIDWYHSRARVTPSMKKEYPTTIEEVLEMGQNKCFFEDDAIKWEEEHIEEGTPMDLLTDNITKKVSAHKTDTSPFKLYRPPLAGHKYKVVVDPITSMSEDSDLFAMSVFDDDNLEQVATFFGKEMPVEDYADYAVSIAKLYNNAMICPETNVAEGFVVSVRALNYYNFYYDSPQNRAKKIPGIRTTVSTKEALLDKLSMLLNNHKLILHDNETVQEMKTFEKKVRMHSDGSVTVKAAARKGKRDDAIACLWVYVGTLDQRQLSGNTKVRYSFL